MLIAKLNTGQIVGLLKYSVPAAFDTRRDDWCLVFTPHNARPRKRTLSWVPSTHIVWRLDFSAPDQP